MRGGSTMAAWSQDEMRKIAEAADLHISPFREDGVTYGTPTWIWSVAVGDALYVRGYNGQSSRWYQAAVRQKAGNHRRRAHRRRKHGAASVPPEPGQGERPHGGRARRGHHAPGLLLRVAEGDVRHHGREGSLQEVTGLSSSARWTAKGRRQEELAYRFEWFGNR